MALFEPWPLSHEIVQPWRCPSEGERFWSETYHRRGTVGTHRGAVMQDGDMDVEFDDGEPPYMDKWWHCWILVDQTNK